MSKLDELRKINKIHIAMIGGVAAVAGVFLFIVLSHGIHTATCNNAMLC